MGAAGKKNLMVHSQKLQTHSELKDTTNTVLPAMFQNKAGPLTSTSASSSSGKTSADLPYGVAPNVHGSFKSCSGKVEVKSRPNVSYADRKANAEAMIVSFGALIIMV